MTTRNPLSTCLLGAALLLASGCSSDPAAEDAAAGSAAVTGGNGNSVAGTAAAAAGHAGALTNGGLGGNLGMGGAGGSSAGSNQAGQSGAGATAGAAGGTGGASSAGGAAGAGGTAGAGGSAPSGPLPPSVTSLFPAPGASGVCVDAPLTINFASKPSIGAKGTIRIYAKASPSTVVDSIDVAATSFSDTIGGQARNLVRPVFIDDNSAVVYFHQHKLSPSTTYFVNISSGTFVDGQQAPLGTVTDQTLWTFTTGPAPAASASMTVDRLGSGQFCTVQGAFDAIAANDAAARTITVASGKYHELLYLSAKKNIKLRGADRAGTVLAYPNNDKLNAGTSARPLFYANGSTGLSIENLTIYNTTPQDGSQAEALRINADQVTVREVNLKSLQDTLQSTGKVYVVDSYIEGNVDFIWGNGPTYFDHCEIKTVGRAGAIVQARNGSGYGFVFVDSKLTADAGVTGQILARIDATAYPSSNVAYLNCQMTGIAAKGWTITPQGTSATGQLRFWEYQSTDASGTALSVSGRDAASKQLSATDAATLRDKATVLGGWNPP